MHALPHIAPQHHCNVWVSPQAAKSESLTCSLSWLIAHGLVLGSPHAGQYFPLGMEGWRFVFLTVALISITIGVLTFLLAHDPRFESDAQVMQQIC